RLREALARRRRGEPGDRQRRSPSGKCAPVAVPGAIPRAGRVDTLLRGGGGPERARGRGSDGLPLRRQRAAVAAGSAAEQCRGLAANQLRRLWRVWGGGCSRRGGGRAAHRRGGEKAASDIGLEFVGSIPAKKWERRRTAGQRSRSPASVRHRP